MHIAVFCLTDDPFDPPGEGPHGGSHKVMFDMGRHFVRRGARVTFVTRRNSPGKLRTQDFGSLCRIYRIDAGAVGRIDYFRCSGLLDDMARELLKLPDLGVASVDRVISYNWVSGEAVLRYYQDNKIQHTHMVLALGRSRRANGESSEKVTDEWISCESRVFLKADRIVTCSNTEYREIIEYYKEVSPKKIFRIPLGVDLDAFEPKPGSPGHSVRRAAARFAQRIGDTD